MNWPETETIPNTFTDTAPAQEDKGSRIKRTATNALTTGEDYVRERPVTTVLTALALGALVGVLLKMLARHEEPAYSRRLGDARHWMEDVYGNVRDRAGDTYSHVRDRAGDTFDTVRDRAGDTFGHVRDRIRKMPERMHLREVPKETAHGYKAAKDWFDHLLDAIRR